MATLEFKGKQIIRNYHLTLKYHSLNGVKKKSLTDKISLNDNLIIHGDTLLALKALLPTYAGKVKCIYIDPPYNTGNEGWKYNDNVNSPMMRDWLGKTVDKDDLTRHDKWLCMMMPRLKLLRDLLTEDGVLFISIDDNEQYRLRGLLDEIFTERNFISCITIKANPRGRQSDNDFATLHDYCICYGKNADYVELNGLPLTPGDIEEFDQTDPDGEKWRELGLRQRGSASLRTDRKDMFFPIYVDPKNGTVSLKPNEIHTIEVIPRKADGREGRWMWSATKVKDEINRVYGRKVTGKERYDIYIKDYLNRNGEQRTSKPRSIWNDTVVNTETGGKELKLILEQKNLEYPKPVDLIKRVIRIGTDKDSLIIDSFAGSGTTAQAVLELNKEDGGQRKFILVECENYADTITAERVRRVIKGIPDSKDEVLKKGLGGTFSYYELGKPLEITKLLEGKDLPEYKELARYVFYTATGDQIDEGKINPEKYYIGESKEYLVYLLYQPKLDYLKSKALTLDIAKSLGEYNGKKHLVFAPTKYMDAQQLSDYHIEFAQLPFEIYKLAK